MGFLDRLFGPPRSTTTSLSVQGIAVRVENTREDIRSDDVIARLEEALGLVAAYAPARLRHLRRDVRLIRVERFPTRGAFFPDDRTVLTELTFLARRDISAAPVASSILHEGVHARVHAFRQRVMGGGGMAADMAREERLCRRVELAFGRALPPALGAPVIERAAASLALEDQDVAPTVDWKLAMQRVEDVDRGA
jgi:hypothetical protein